MSPSERGPTYRFDEFVLDSAALELRQSDTPVDVQLKVLDLLVYLIRNRERMVEKRELMSALWPDEIVAETSLTQAVKTARRVIGDDGQAQRRIKTMRGRGYRFIGEVDEGAANAADALPTGPVASADPGAAAAGNLVGRAAETRRFVEIIDAAIAGQGALLLLHGDPGAGKSTLAEHLAVLARERGVEVQFGHAPLAIEGAPSAHAWLQLVRALAEERDDETLGKQMGAGAGVLASRLPELVQRLGVTATGGEDFELFDAISTFLRSAARARPLVCVLDDLHRADESTAELLRFIGSECAGRAILLVGVYRDTEVDDTHPLARELAPLRSGRGLISIAVGGLARAELAELIQRDTGAVPPASFVELVAERTEGNPFLTRELLRHWRQNGVIDESTGHWATASGLDGAGPSAGVRDALGARVSGVSDGCRDVLESAAVLGREFQVAALERLRTRDSRLAVRRAIDEALSARILRTSDADARHLGFSHAFLRDVVYGAMSPDVRRETHLRIAKMLEAVHLDDTNPPLARICDHFFAALPLVELDKVIGYARAAARSAVDREEPTEAVQYWERVLGLLEGKPGVPRNERTAVRRALEDARAARDATH